MKSRMHAIGKEQEQSISIANLLKGKVLNRKMISNAYEVRKKYLE